MRKQILLVAVAGLLVVALPPTAAGGSQQLSGSYALGSPLDYQFSDACANDGTPRDDLTSSCVPIPGTIRGGLSFTLATDDALGTVQDAQVCFYKPAGIKLCRGEAGIVPEEATRLSVTSVGGVQVSWTITFS